MLEPIVKMKPEVKDIWVNEGLLSGNYTQCRTRLQRNGAFCCLGVLTDLYIKHTGKGEWFTDKNGATYFKGEHKRSEATCLPYEVAEWAGVPVGGNIMVIPSDCTGKGYSAMGLNDSEGWSFEQIAEAVKENL